MRKRSALVSVVAVVFLVACTGAPHRSATPMPEWLLDAGEPFPFVSPAPPRQVTEIDGAYVRTSTTAVSRQLVCRRCPAYPPDAGTSRLVLGLGRYTLEHEAPPYRTVGHYSVDGSTVTFFNDPECPYEVGRYGWRIVGAELILESEADSCAGGQRARDLTESRWATAAAYDCQPPDHEAAVTGHWPAPSGC